MPYVGGFFARCFRRRGHSSTSLLGRILAFRTVLYSWGRSNRYENMVTDLRSTGYMSYLLPMIENMSVG
jgi:hypothetical protein